MADDPFSEAASALRIPQHPPHQFTTTTTSWDEASNDGRRTSYSNPLFLPDNSENPRDRDGLDVAAALTTPPFGNPTPSTGGFSRPGRSAAAARAATHLLTNTNRLLLLIPILLAASLMARGNTQGTLGGLISSIGRTSKVALGMGHAATMASRALSALGISGSGSGSGSWPLESTMGGTQGRDGDKGWDPNAAVRVVIVVPRYKTLCGSVVWHMHTNIVLHLCDTGRMLLSLTSGHLHTAFFLQRYCEPLPHHLGGGGLAHCTATLVDRPFHTGTDLLHCCLYQVCYKV